jgi:hypothetical protein
MLTRLPDSRIGSRQWRGEKHGAAVSVAVTSMHHRWCWALDVNGVGRLSKEQACASADEATTAAFTALASMLAEVR